MAIIGYAMNNTSPLQHQVNKNIVITLFIFSFLFSSHIFSDSHVPNESNTNVLEDSIKESRDPNKGTDNNGKQGSYLNDQANKIKELDKEIQNLNKAVSLTSNDIFNTSSRLLQILIGMLALFISCISVGIGLLAFFGIKGIKEMKKEITTEITKEYEKTIKETISNQVSKVSRSIEPELTDLTRDVDLIKYILRSKGFDNNFRWPENNHSEDSQTEISEETNDSNDQDPNKTIFDLDD